MFGCFDKHNLRKCKQESHGEMVEIYACACFFQIYNTFVSLISRESIAPLVVTERQSYTCTLTAVKTSC